MRTHAEMLGEDRVQGAPPKSSVEAEQKAAKRTATAKKKRTTAKEATVGS